MDLIKCLFFILRIVNKYDKYLIEEKNWYVFFFSKCDGLGWFNFYR